MTRWVGRRALGNKPKGVWNFSGHLSCRFACAGYGLSGALKFFLVATRRGRLQGVQVHPRRRPRSSTDCARCEFGFGASVKRAQEDKRAQQFYASIYYA